MAPAFQHINGDTSLRMDLMTNLKGEKGLLFENTDEDSYGITVAMDEHTALDFARSILNALGCDLNGNPALTETDMEALPVGKTVIDKDNDEWSKNTYGGWSMPATPGYLSTERLMENYGPIYGIA